MPHSIVMPALSAGMEEGTIARWLKSAGDPVAVGEVIAEVETDKATMELEADVAGTIGQIVAQGGTTVAVNDPIAFVLLEGESLDALAGSANVSLPAPAKQVEAEATPAESAIPVTGIEVADHSERRKNPASPLARRLAREKGLEISNLTGSGPGGRIVRLDIEAATARQSAQPEALVASPSAAPAPIAQQSPASQIIPIGQAYDEVPLSGMRKVIARRLAEAKSTIPHFYLEVDCEIDALLELRETLNAQSNGQYKLSVNDFVIKAAALALRQVPEANTAWIDNTMVQFREVDISVAVATDGGLITPIVRQADRIGLSSISAEVKVLATRAREGRLQPAEYQGGSFTISNLGMYGVRAFSAIINPPQSCILAVGAAERRAVVKGDACVPATVMSCTLSVDHRAVDGAVGAQFIAAFKALIEQPLRMMV